MFKPSTTTAWLGKQALLISLLVTGGVAQEPALVLEEAIGIALIHNRSLMGRRLAVEDARWSLEVEKSVFTLQAGPRIDAGSRGGDATLEAGVQVRKEWSQGLEVQVDSGYRETENSFGSGPFTRIRASQFLFRRAGSLVNREPLRQADRNLLNSQRAVVARQQELVLEVVRSYEAALRSEGQAEADSRAAKRRKQQLARTKAQEAGGLATRLDTLRAELEAGEAELRVNNSQEAVKRSREALAQLLGDSPRSLTRLQAPDLIPPKRISTNQGVEIALLHRLDVAQARDAIEDAARGVNIARKNQLPDMALTVELEPLDPSATNEDFDFSGDRWFVGLTLRPDLSPLEEEAGLAQAQNLQERLELVWDQLLQDLRIEIRQAIRNEGRTRAEYEQAQQNLVLAEKRLKLASIRFRLGQTSSETVSDAEDALAQAERESLAARAEASIAGYELLAALGTLVEPPDELAP